jgi:hypothetical protein
MGKCKMQMGKVNAKRATVSAKSQFKILTAGGADDQL